MTDATGDASASDGARRWQFSIREILLVTLVAAIVLGVASQIPAKFVFAATLSLMMLVTLSVAAGLRDVLLFVIAVKRGSLEEAPRRPDTNMPSPLWLALRFFAWLDLWPFDREQGIRRALVIAISCTVVAIGGWPAIREIGQTCAVVSSGAIRDAWGNMAGVPATLSNANYWLRLWQWETWAIGRWWLLFCLLTFGWLVVIVLWPGRDKILRTTQVTSRLLGLAPWLIFLEIALLIGVWAYSPMTIPEPSTGFVVGVFDWSKWHWDCCWDREWLRRAALPTFVVGFVFFKGVVRWHWLAAIVAAIGLVPVAILLSIANTVAFQNGFPDLFG